LDARGSLGGVGDVARASGRRTDPPGLRGDRPHGDAGGTPARTTRPDAAIASFVSGGTVIYAGSTIVDDFATGHNVVIREENLIGNGVSIWGGSTVDYGCRIADRVKIHTGVYVAQFSALEEDVFLAPGVVLANDPHPGCPRSKDCMRGPTIKRGAQIGVNATIVPFVTVGEFALVGAGSVVTMDVPARAVVYGNPARVVASVADLRCIVDPPLIDRPYPSER
jgi:acetyltransferase-like isoleucine patch superfamily enzyme